jgi:hypothetical protein
VPEATSPAASDPTINEDGHVLKSRRGLLAAGLAVVVAGALGVASTLNAGAEQITGVPDQPAAAEAPQADEPATPPSVLPWGSRPERIRKGWAGATSRSLRANGYDAAPNDTSGSQWPRGRYAPKGRSTKGNYLRSELTDVAPPEPSAEPTDTASPTAEPTTEPTTAPTGDPAPTSTDPVTTTVAASATTNTPVALASTTVPPDNGEAKVNYIYNVGSQQAETDGVYTNVTIAKPRLDKSDYHTLAELAVQSADGKQIVEVGWNIDRVVNGDDDPHLFVYHWVNRVPTCYNGCGFEQYSKNVKPGDTLTYDVTKKFGIQYFNGAWWIAFDSEWIGYFPEKLWNDQGVKFSRTGLVQVFGEVAASSDKPCTQMGNGQPGDSAAAALLASVTYLNGPVVAMNVRSTTDYYSVAALSTRSFRYGGPGAC